MANLCSTRITFYSKNEQMILTLKQKLEEINARESAQENDFGKDWLGNFVKTFYPEIDASDVDCRGILTDIDTEVKRHRAFYGFDIWTQTAWTAKIGMWYKILEDYYPDVKLAYIAEESGFDYYVVWDEDNLFDFYEYFFDMCCPSDDGEKNYVYDHEFASMHDIFDWLDENLPFGYTKTNDICALENEISEKLDEYDDDELFCTIAQYMKISPSEYEFFRT